jgi:hypothetical protein
MNIFLTNKPQYKFTQIWRFIERFFRLTNQSLQIIWHFINNLPERVKLTKKRSNCNFNEDSQPIQSYITLFLLTIDIL